MLRFDLTDLRLYVNIVDGGSVTAGARASHLSPGSASARLATLEASLGQRLLERGRGPVRPTVPGIALLGHARDVLAQVELLHAGMQRYLREDGATIRMLCNTSSGSELLPALLPAWLASRPGVSVDIEERTSEDIVALVGAGDWQLGIICDAVDARGLQSVPLGHDPLVAVAPAGHPLAQRADLCFADCLDEDFVALGAESALARHLARRAADLSGHLRIRVRLRSLDDVCRVVGQGIGVSVVPLRAARRNARRDSLAVLQLRDGWARRRLHVCCRDLGALALPARELADYLAQAWPAISAD